MAPREGGCAPHIACICLGIWLDYGQLCFDCKTSEDWYRAGSPKNCVSHATPYSRYVSSRKRLIIFAYVFLFLSDEDCIQQVLIRSLNFSGIYKPERKKSTNPILTLVHEKYE